MKKSPDTVWHQASITRDLRQQLNAHRSAVIWFTGLSGSGKSSLSHAVEERLFKMNCRTYVLDGDNVRHGLCGDLGFSASERNENIRRIGEMSKLFVDAGIITLSAFISPFKADRQLARQLFVPGDFIEVYCSCPLEVCERRDVKGVYQKARAGKIKNFTGISSPYEPPANPELVIDTANSPLEQCVDQVIDYLYRHEIILSPQ
jgi:adenylylsulfate kinase